MASYFLDSSALVKGYRLETGTPRINQLLRGSDPLIVSQLAHLEVSSAIVRRAFGSQAPDLEVQQSLAELDREIALSFDVIPIDGALLATAIRLARSHRLRAADAVQLASAVIALGRRSQEVLIMVSADDDLNVAATAEGLAVENPNNHP